MDPYTQQPTQQTSPAPAAPAPSADMHDKEKVRRSLIAIVVVVVLAVVVFFIWHRANKSKTPEEVLEDLARSSQPVTATPAEREASLRALQQTSVQTNKSQSERVQDLNSLEQY